MLDYGAERYYTECVEANSFGAFCFLRMPSFRTNLYLRTKRPSHVDYKRPAVRLDNDGKHERGVLIPLKAGNMATTYDRKKALIENGGKFSGDDWATIKKLYDSRCLSCCDQEGISYRYHLEGQKVILTADHIVALRNGGANDVTNIQPLCKSCNCSKHSRFDTDYRDMFFDKLRAKYRINLLETRRDVIFRVNLSLRTRWMPPIENIQAKYSDAQDMLYCWRLPPDLNDIAKRYVDDWFKAA